MNRILKGARARLSLVGAALVVTHVACFVLGFRARNDLSRDLTAYLGTGSGLRVTRLGDYWVIDGEVDGIDKQHQLASLVRAINAREGNRIIPLARLSDRAKQDLVARVNRLSESSDLLARYVGAYLVLEGTADSDFEADRFVMMAKSLIASGANEPRSVLGGIEKEKPAAQPLGDDVGQIWPFAIADLIRIRPAPSSLGRSAK